MNKQVIILSAFCLLVPVANAQILDPTGTAKRKATDRVNSRVDQSIDKGFDKVEEGVGGLFKRKDKKKSEAPSPNPSQPENNSAGSRVDAMQLEPDASQAKSTSFTTYSKFDFIPGEKIIATEDFSQDAIGDFPAKWNTDGSGEVVTVEGKRGKWFKFTGQGTFYPEFLKLIPENATIEFELATDETHHIMTLVHFIDKSLYSNLLNRRYANQVSVTLDPIGSSEIIVNDSNEDRVMSNKKEVVMWRVPEKPSVKISMWRQKARLRVYMDETKVWDIPRAFQPGAEYRMAFETNSYFIEGRELFFSNLTIAAGMPDTRNKLLSEGKFVTTGILFDTDSDVIRPASYAVLNEIGQTLAENMSVKIRVTGHTDSQGDDKHNLTLSAKRAQAVKLALTSHWGVSADRIQTNGQGESQPIADNATPEGRANNRRVEFTKL